jgi:hypothetical protein
MGHTHISLLEPVADVTEWRKPRLQPALGEASRAAEKTYEIGLLVE